MTIGCTVEGCKNQYGAKRYKSGYCPTHYSRWHKYGDPLAPWRKQCQKGLICSHAGCDKDAKSLGMCALHYEISRRATEQYKALQRGYSEKMSAQRQKDREAAMGRPRPLCCEACGDIGRKRGKSRNRIVYDHDHKTGKARGWLCDRCNTILGLARDNHSVLNRLAKYLDLYGNGIAFSHFGAEQRVWHETDGVPYVPLFAN